MPSKKGHRFTVYTEEFRRQIAEESEKVRIEGGSLADLAKIRGVPLATMYVWRRMHGFVKKRMVPEDFDDLPRSGTSYIAGHNYTEPVDSIAKSLRYIESYSRFLSLTVCVIGILVCLYYLLKPYFIA